MPPIERKSFTTQTEARDEGIVEAIVSVFSNVDRQQECIRPGFFKESLARKLPKGVWSHQWDMPIAKTLEARELEPGDSLLPPPIAHLGGLFVKGQFNLETTAGREVFSNIKFGIIDEFSIGYEVTEDALDKKSGVRELISGTLFEWSPVLVGANPETQLLSVKTLEQKAWEEKENEIWYRVRDPGGFQEDSFRRIQLQKSPPIYAVIGRLKGETTTTVQALRFPKDSWSMAEAKKWVADHRDSLKSVVELEQRRETLRRLRMNHLARQRAPRA
jgi:HK97 family phage prohead protease